MSLKKEAPRGILFTGSNVINAARATGPGVYLPNSINTLHGSDYF